MGEAAQKLKMSPEEYLSFERASTEKHEYVDGEILAMSGGTLEHTVLAQNIGRVLGNALLSRPCLVAGSDIKIKAAGKYFYPDVSVICGPPVFEDATRDVVLNPKLIVEVLSDSTEAYDRGGKFTSYRAVSTLTDYVLVSQREVLVEHFHRLPDGTWIFRALGPGEVLVLSSLECEVPLEGIYLKVFPAA